MSCFKSDINFCPECGNILPVPLLKDDITCPRCSFKISVRGKISFYTNLNRCKCLASPMENIHCTWLFRLSMILSSVCGIRGRLYRSECMDGLFIVLTCILCLEFAGQVITSSVVFNPLDESSSAVESKKDSELSGPVVDRRCSRCNKEGMVYHTRQMRSADEGQTVFFTCIHCRYQEKEDS
uniref:DNA-directed RNA polymerase I subunit RPA12 n=1 Tax=Electrophorus electricus TaxID=8005 RepID=A0AAY5E7W6_ELEEL